MRRPRAIVAERGRAQRALDRPSLAPPSATPLVTQPSESPEKVEHPVIGSMRPWFVRVLRVVKESDGVTVRRYELLGEHRDVSDAIVQCSEEKWRAVVADRNNRPVYNNGQPFKVGE
jgi:hypothetical protein